MFQAYPRLAPSPRASGLLELGFDHPLASPTRKAPMRPLRDVLRERREPLSLRDGLGD